jgi:hypothetical protein
MAYVATGPPPIVDGVIAEAKSQVKITRNDAGQLSILSLKIRYLAARNQSRNNVTTNAMMSPGNRFSWMYSNPSGLQVKYITAPIVTKLKDMENTIYLTDK